MAVPAFYMRREFLAETAKYVEPPDPIPEGSMRVAPGSDALVWLVNPRDCGEL